MNNILKYPGSKWNIAEWIISNFPAGYEKMNYLEPFFGSGAVFFTKRRSQIETINDIDDNVVNLFQVARDHPEELARAVYFTPWARSEYKKSYEDGEFEGVEKARRFLVRMWQAIGAKSSTTTGWRKNVKGVNGNVPQFSISLPENILAVCDRLKHASGSMIVQIECKDAFELIERHNTADMLIYADPPYVRSTRSGNIYKHEFLDDDHRRLLSLLMEHKGYVVLSGYACYLYDNALAGWRRYEKVSQTEAANKAVEVLWLNYEPPQEQMMLEV
jgi:DNA adenine methylase